MLREHPFCFTSKAQFDKWAQAAAGSRPGRSGYCTDCTPEYQARMKDEHRCGFPSVTFYEDDDGFVAGRR